MGCLAGWFQLLGTQTDTPRWSARSCHRYHHRSPGLSVSCTVGLVTPVPRPDIDTLASMAPNDRLEAIRSSLVTDPADLSPAQSKMVADGWAELDAVRQSSSKS